MLRGKRIFLRPVEESDLELLARWRNHPANQRFFFSPFLVNPGGQKKFFEQLLADRTRVWFMIETLDGQTVGMCGLNNIDWHNQECEGGQLVLDPDERGKGYAEEAAFLSIRYAFEELNMHRIYGYCFAYNPILTLLKEVFGFKQEGVLRKSVFTGGKFHDKVVVGLLREEWQEEVGRDGIGD